MDEEAEELKQRMSRLEDDELLKIVTTSRSNYREVAIDLATEELLRRSGSPNSPIDESFILNLDNQYTSLSYSKVSSSSEGNNIWTWITILILLSNLARGILQPNSLNNLLETLTSTFGAIPVAIIGGLFILPLGMTLYAIRERRLMLYARLEILFGIFYGIYTIGDKNHWGTIKDSGTSNLATWTALAASLYIVVRGLDNRNKAMMKENAAKLKEEEAREKEEEAKRKIEYARHKEEMEKIKERLKQEREQKERMHKQKAQA